MKTLISIPGNTASEVLKVLNENNIPCVYIGLDQAGRIIMEITYEPAQAVPIKKLNDYMKQYEEWFNSLASAMNEALELQLLKTAKNGN
jgi:hypothetical protein